MDRLPPQHIDHLLRDLETATNQVEYLLQIIARLEGHGDKDVARQKHLKS